MPIRTGPTSLKSARHTGPEAAEIVRRHVRPDERQDPREVEAVLATRAEKEPRLGRYDARADRRIVTTNGRDRPPHAKPEIEPLDRAITGSRAEHEFHSVALDRG